MSDRADRFEGGCLCGAVRFVANGQPKGVYWCHCQSCRRHSGAPVSVFVAFERAAYTVTHGEITKFEFDAGADNARILRTVRLDLDLRGGQPADRNALPCRRF